MATLLAVASVCCLGAAFARPSRRHLPAELARLATLGPQEIATRQDAARPVWERLLDPVIAALARRLRPGWAGMTAEDLRRAGLDTDRLGVAEMVAIKVLCGGMGAAVALSIAALAPGALLFAPAITFGPARDPVPR